MQFALSVLFVSIMSASLGCAGDSAPQVDGGASDSSVLPARLDIAGTLAEPAMVAVADAGGGSSQVTLSMSATALRTTPATDLTGLDFSSARYPSAPGCASAVWEVAVPGADLLQLTLRGTDLRPALGCENFARRLARDGVSVSAENVLQNGRPILVLLTLAPGSA